MVNVLLMLWLNIPLAIELYDDYKDIKAGVLDKHGKDLVIRTILVVMFSLVSGVFKDSNYLVGFISSLCFATGCYILIFDYALNKLRGLKWDYLGKEAETDRLLKRYNPYHVLIVKSLAFIAGSLLYIFL